MSFKEVFFIMGCGTIIFVALAVYGFSEIDRFLEEPRIEICKAYGYEGYEFGGYEVKGAGWLDQHCYNTIKICNIENVCISEKELHYLTQRQVQFYNQTKRTIE